MADLPPEQLRTVFRQTVEEYVKLKPTDLSKQDFKDAIQATSNWLDDNAASYLNALPAKFRNNAPISIIGALLAFVALIKSGNR